MLCAVLVAVLSIPQAKEPDRVGRIIIEGNVDTPDRVILSAMGQRPGQVLDRAKLELAERRLGRLGLFRSATVEALPNELDSTFKDIRIRVEERSWVWLTFASEDLVIGTFTLDEMRLQDTVERLRYRFRGKAR